MNAHLFFERCTSDVIELTKTAVRVDPILGNNEQGQALCTGRSALGTGQHQMDDIFSEIVVSLADEDLVAG